MLEYTQMQLRLRKGQAMLEYVLAFAALVGVIAVTGYLLTASQYAVTRTERLVGSDYP